VHPSPKAPPQVGSFVWSTYLLYGLSIISALLVLHFFVLRRTQFVREIGTGTLKCCGGRGDRRLGAPGRRNRADRRGNQRRIFGGGKKHPRGAVRGYDHGWNDSSSDEDDYGRGRQPVHVNVMIDPRYFGGSLPSLPAPLPPGSLPFTKDPDGSLSWKDASSASPLPPAFLQHPRSTYFPSSSYGGDGGAGGAISVPGVSPFLTPSMTALTAQQSGGAPRAIGRRARRAQRFVQVTDQDTVFKLMMLDLFFGLSWVAVFIYLVLRSSASAAQASGGGSAYCPPGGFGGWCNGYNTARAAGLLLGLASLGAVVLDAQDRRALAQAAQRSAYEVEIVA
jgi:hypothetical protein